MFSFSEGLLLPSVEEEEGPNCLLGSVFDSCVISVGTCCLRVVLVETPPVCFFSRAEGLSIFCSGPTVKAGEERLGGRKQGRQ